MSDEEKSGGSTAAPEGPANEEQKDTGCTEAVRAPLIAAKPGPSEVAEATGGLVREALLNAVRGGHDLLDAASEAGAGVAGAASKGAVTLWLAARGAGAGTVAAAHELSRDPQPALNAITRSMMNEMLSSDGDFGAAAKGAVEGAIWGYDLAGLEPGLGCRLTAKVALETAREARFGAGERVRHILREPIDTYETGIE